MAIAVVAALSVGAQEPDLAAIAKMRKVKIDSLSMMLGKVYATQAAMNHTTTQARATLLKAFDESVNIEKQDEQFKEGNSIASGYFKVAEDMKNRNGITMKRDAFAQALLKRFADTTILDINAEVQDINTEARRLMDELKALNKDTVNKDDLMHKSNVLLKSDSLSMNMGRFYGLQLLNMSKQKKLNGEQIARLLEGFNSAINIDEDNKPLVDGKMLSIDYLNIEQGIKKQLSFDLNKEVFVNAFSSVLNDPKVPTEEEFKALDKQAKAYISEVRTFAQENSPEALTQKGLGRVYVENIMEKDPGFIKAPSGLVYKIINPGNGKKFSATDKIKVMYKGTHVDGKTFDESKEPVAFAPSQVVPGFREALLMMSPGAKMIAVLPYDLAYGARGAGQSIKPFETLVFEIETLGLDEGAAQVNDAKIGKAAVSSQSTDKKAVEPKASTGKASKAKSGTAKKKTSKRKK